MMYFIIILLNYVSVYKKIVKNQSMQNITQLAEQLINHQHFQIMLKDLINSINNNKHQPTQPAQLKTVIDQITNNITHITQSTVKVSTASLFLQLSQNNQQLINTLCQKMQNDIKQQLLAFNHQLQQHIKFTTINQHSSYKQNRKSLLNQKRRILGQNILNLTKYQQPICQKSCQWDVSFDSILHQSSFNQQLSILLQQSQYKLKQQIDQKFKGKFEISQKNLSKLTNRFVDMKVRVEEQIEAGFKGIWNVINNIQSQIESLSKSITKY